MSREVGIATSVTRLIPRVAPFAEAQSAFRAADYYGCLARLEGNASFEAGLLGARALLRQRRTSEAERLLQMLSYDLDRTGTMRNRAEHAMLLASAHSHRESSATDEAFRTARVLAIASCDDALLGEVEMLMGVVAFMHGDLERASEQVRRVVEETADVVVNCWARQTRGAIAAVRGDLAAQLADEEANLAALSALAERDVWLESWVLYNLAVLSRELDRHDVAAAVQERAATLAWTAATALQEFQMSRHLAYAAALRGDNVATFRHLRKSAEVAPSASWKIQVVLDGAFFYRELGELTAMTERVDAAQELAAGIEWETTAGEERFALLELVELLAATDTPAAKVYLATYQSLPKKIAPHLIYSIDPRPRALEIHRRGLVAAALGQTVQARQMLSEALAFWESRRILWRAATAAIELAILTREASDVERAARYAELWPRSWFACRLSAATR